MDESTRKHLIDALHAAGLHTVDGAFDFTGGRDLPKPALGHRRRIEFSLTDGTGKVWQLFLKLYSREPAAWRLRRVMTYGWGRSPAEIEHHNLQALSRIGLGGPQPLTHGTRQDRSYVIFTAVPGRQLATYPADLFGPLLSDSTAATQLTDALAALARTLHEAGYVHRDLYTSHIFLDRTDSEMRLHLIDLARAFHPRWRPFRWRVKDLAQLRCSMPEQWQQQQWGGFLDAYLPDATATLRRRWDRAVSRKAASILRRAKRKYTQQT